MSQRFCSLKKFWPNGPDCPIAFCDVEGKEEGGSSHHKVHQESKSNRMEAEKIVSYLICAMYVTYNDACGDPQVEIIAMLKQKAKQSMIKEPGIAVLTPYKAQKKLIEDIVKEKKLGVRVCTINESQGDRLIVYYCCHTLLYRK